MRKKQNRYRVQKRKPGRVIVAWLQVVSCYFLILASILGLSALLSRSYHALLDGPWLKVENIEISGLKHIERKDVLNVMGVTRNASVLTLKMAEIAKRIETMPWVKSASVRLDLPRRIVVEITEREPVALVYTDDLLLMDAEGNLFLKGDIKRFPGLLLVTGFSGKNLAEGSLFPSEALDGLKELMAALEVSKHWLPLNQISECRWHKDEGFTLFMTQKAIPVELGWDEYDLKLERLQRALGALAERQVLDMVNRIDLDYSNRAYIGGDFPAPKGI